MGVRELGRAASSRPRVSSEAHYELADSMSRTARTMSDSRNVLFCAAVIALVFCCASASASIITIDRNSRGAYDSTGATNESGYLNEFPTGRVASGYEARHWIRFDVPLLPSTTPIVSASLRLGLANYVSIDGAETYEAREVTTNATLLGANFGVFPPASTPSVFGRAVFDDLGDGAVYGSASLSASDGVVLLTLSDDALNALNSLAHRTTPLYGASGNMFVVGGQLATLNSDRSDLEAVFCSPAVPAFGIPECPLLNVRHNTHNVSELILATAPSAPPPGGTVPEPGSLALITGALLAFGFSRRTLKSG